MLIMIVKVIFKNDLIFAVILLPLCSIVFASGSEENKSSQFYFVSDDVLAESGSIHFPFQLFFKKYYTYIHYAL